MPASPNKMYYADPPTSWFVVTRQVKDVYYLLKINDNSIKKCHRKFILGQIKLDVATLFSAKETSHGLDMAKKKSHYAQMIFYPLDGSVGAKNVIVKKERHYDTLCYSSQILGRIKCCDKSQIYTMASNQMINIRVRLLKEKEKVGIFQFSNWAEEENENVVQHPKTVPILTNFPREIMEEIGLVVKTDNKKYTIWNPNLFFGSYNIELLGGDKPNVGSWLRMKFTKLEHNIFFANSSQIQDALNISCSSYDIFKNTDYPTNLDENSEVKIKITLRTSTEHIVGNPMIHEFFGTISDREKFLTEPSAEYQLEIKYNVSIHQGVISVWKIVNVEKMTILKRSRKHSSVSQRLFRNTSQPPQKSIEENLKSLTISEPSTSQKEATASPSYEKDDNITWIKSKSFVFDSTDGYRFMWIIDRQEVAHVDFLEFGKMKEGYFYEAEFERETPKSNWELKNILTSIVSDFPVSSDRNNWSIVTIELDEEEAKQCVGKTSTYHKSFGKILDKRGFLSEYAPCNLDIEYYSNYGKWSICGMADY